MTSMVRAGGAPLAQAAGSLTRDQVELLKKTIARGASDDELALFLEVCKAKRLDPFSGQIHAVKRSERNPSGDGFVERLTFQIGIDGFRTIAERTGERDGQDAPEWCGPDEKWKTLWLGAQPPVAARVRVYRKGHARPYEAIAYWSFYVQTKRDGSPNRMWERGGPHMLAKCAEALAYRMAFPDQLDGIYAPEELDQAEAEPARPAYQPAPSAPPAASAPVDDGSARALLERILAAAAPADLEALLPELGKVAKGSPAYKELRDAYGAKKARLAAAEGAP